MKKTKMAIKVTKEKLLKDLNELKEIAELPTLYLSNYFSDLKSDVDKHFAPKQLELENDYEKKKELEELWQKMIATIDEFEGKVIKKIYNLESNKNRLTKIETMLNIKDNIDLNETDQIIQEEEINLLSFLFQNRTIVFFQNNQLKEGKLILVNDEFISKKERYKFIYFFHKVKVYSII